MFPSLFVSLEEKITGNTPICKWRNPPGVLRFD
jgi:hypothetical protein